MKPRDAESAGNNATYDAAHGGDATIDRDRRSENQEVDHARLRDNLAYDLGRRDEELSRLLVERRTNGGPLTDATRQALDALDGRRAALRAKLAAALAASFTNFAATSTGLAAEWSELEAQLDALA